MNQETEDLKNQVEQTKTVEASAKALIDGFAARLTAAIDREDWDVVTTLRDDLNASSSELAAAVEANTPSA